MTTPAHPAVPAAGRRASAAPTDTPPADTPPADTPPAATASTDAGLTGPGGVGAPSPASPPAPPSPAAGSAAGPSTPPAGATTPEGRPVAGSLSPSRAADFVNCPLRYRFRVIDRLPEPPSEAATRGTVVHAVLERLFDLPPARRTLAAAEELVEPAWADLREREPQVATLFDTPEALQAWLDSARELLAGYFAMEDPRRLAPAARELYVEHVLDSGLRLRGYVDRLDEASTPQGPALRIVDYKTGRSPGPAFETSAMFQMRFYALLLWRVRGVIPRELRLYYLGDRTWLRATPDESDLRATERRIEALWAAITRAHRTGDWRATPGRLCAWCDHKARCPAFGGTPPPLPDDASALPVDDEPTVCEADG